MIARHEGRVVLVAGAVPGDTVQAEIRRDRGRFVEAIARSISLPSPARRATPCPVQESCGGCPLMPVGEDDQREAKRRFVVDALERIAKIEDPPVDPIEAPRPWLGYRGKIEMVFGRDASDRRVFGYHSAGDASVVDVPACAIADPRLGPLVDLVRAFFLDDRRAAPPERVAFRASTSGADRLIAFFGGASPAATLSAFARDAMARERGLTGVVALKAAPGRRGGASTITLAGRPWIEETILGTSFRVPAGTFLQVHPRAADLLGRHLLDASAGVASVVELYGGVGGFGLALARRGAHVTIVEADAAAVQCGRDAAERAGVASARFVRGDAGEFLETAPAADLLVADPPRTGFGRGVAQGIARLAPGRIALVSCDPATLARDVLGLARAGYRLLRVTPFDLFPQTAHVEAVAWLTR
ncbi:MAG TPA: class I SAM-dependent RNA methyltransferase [Candidatus Polarisedimenticolaceae bacterium]|nr:class I SAM-dependent RNA methyltransferase [Candidatus Polarisedimenticolaceae bacterium]